MIQAVDRAAIGAQPELGLTSCEEHQWVQRRRLRVCPKTSGGITKCAENEADCVKPQKRQRVAIEVLPILCKPSAAVEPSKGAFDDPTPWKHHESFRPIGALDDFSFELWQDPRQGLLKVRPLVATIGKELFQERVHPEKGRKKQDAAIAILDIGRMNDGVQQQTQRVYENMALLALDLFARVIAMRIDAAPLFQRSSRFGYRRWRRSGWLLVRLAPDTPHKARDGCDPACRRSSTSRDSRKVCCAAADLSGSHATGILCSKYT